MTNIEINKILNEIETLILDLFLKDNRVYTSNEALTIVKSVRKSVRESNLRETIETITKEIENDKTI